MPRQIMEKVPGIEGTTPCPKRSKDLEIITRMKQKRDGSEARAEGSLIDGERNDRALRYEKLGAQTRERGVEEGALSATLPHS